MKTTFISFIIFLTVFTLHAQTSYLKVADHGGIEKVIRINSGGYLTAGYDSVWKVHVIKWDDNYNVLWKIRITDANFTGGHCYITEANDGNFYFMGNSTEHSGCTFIMKISSNGSVLWQKLYYINGGFLSSLALSAASGNDNGFLFGGGQCALSNDIVKCDANGNIEWQQQYLYPLSTGVITCWSIIPDGEGYTVSSGYNVNSLLTFKINSTGTVQSQSAYTYTGMQILPTRIVKLNNNGGYAIMGNYNSSNNNKTEFVAIYNSALQLQSFNELTVTYQQFILWDVTAHNNGANIFVNGSIYDNYVFYIAVIYMDNSGNILWKKLGAGNNTTTNKNVEFYGVCLKGNTLVNTGFGYNEGCVFGLMDGAGYGLCNEQTFNLNNVLRTLTLQSQTIYTAAATVVSANAAYTYDNTVATHKQEYCANLGIEGQTDEQDANILIYPNPANDNFMIDCANEKDPDLFVYNIMGELVLQKELTRNMNEIDIRTLPKGIYVIKVSTAEGSVQKKLIKE